VAVLGRLVIIVVLLLLNGYFVGVEFALVRSRRTRLEAMARGGDRLARLALRAVAKDTRGGIVGRAVQWASTDPTIAAVASNGVVTGVAPGTATITATSDGVRGRPIAVTVVAAGPGPPGILQMLIMPSWAFVSVNGLPKGQRTRGVDTLPSGVTYRLHFERAGFIPVDTTVTLRPDERRLIRIQMRQGKP